MSRHDATKMLRRKCLDCGKPCFIERDGRLMGDPSFWLGDKRPQCAGCQHTSVQKVLRGVLA